MTLTLLTVGLYWPFAAVAIARYRVEAMTVVGDRPLEELLIHFEAERKGGLVGDAAADGFGLDLGW